MITVNKVGKTQTINLVKSWNFFLVHLVALGVFFVPFRWELLALCIGYYYLRMFAITGGYHRYFAHKSYKMRRIPQFLMAVLGTLALQKGPLWWAAHHRHHHRHSDLPSDLHSPIRDGFWWSHVGWILSNGYDETRYDLIPDFAKFPELVWLNKYHWVPGTIVGISILLFGGADMFFWVFCLSTVLLWHGTFIINSLCHVFGGRRYETTDTSRNNLLFALITLGEGWHNNHHCYDKSTRQGFFWWEIDITYWILKLLSVVGITYDLNEPPLEKLKPFLIKKPGRTRRVPVVKVATSQL